MKLRFIDNISIAKISNICCFSGAHKREEITFKAGDEIEYNGLSEERRLDAPNGRKGDKVVDIFISDRTLHPNRYIDVPIKSFEAIE